MLSNKELLQKANLVLSDFGGSGEAPLSVEQVEQFLLVAITPQKMLPEVRIVKSSAAKWQESVLNFSSRMMKPGTEFTRLTTGNRVVPDPTIVEIDTSIIRGEVPISDEVMEDNVARAGFADIVMGMIAERAGSDIEELFVKGDIADAVIGHGETSDYLNVLDGWLETSYTDGGNTYDASSDGDDYQKIFKLLLSTLDDKYKSDLANWRYYVPQRLEERYRDQIAARGTPLGDLQLTGNSMLKYQGIEIKGVPHFPITAGSPDTSFILMTHRLNLYGGFRREIKLETYRDPREGGTSFIVTARVDAEIALTDATTIAYTVDVEPD